MRGTVSAASPWDVMVDLFFYREPEETKEDAPQDEAHAPGAYNEPAFPAPDTSMSLAESPACRRLGLSSGMRPACTCE